MALVPTITYELDNEACSWLKLTDATVYGEPEADRADVLTYWRMTRKDSTGDVEIALPYNPATATTLQAKNLRGYGWYQIVLEIRNAEGQLVAVPKKKNLLLTCSIRNCICALQQQLLDKGCGCEEDKLVRKIGKLRAILDAAGTVFSTGNMQGAVRFLEMAATVCAVVDDCGCH